MWPEIYHVHNENRHELILCGNNISQRLEQSGVDKALFKLISLNLLRISDTCLEELPDEISGLVNLQSLLLHSNKLHKISVNIGELSKLKVLDLSNNQLCSIPENILKLSQLSSMNLSSNKLEKFPAANLCGKLSVLDLSHNKLQEFPDICHSELELLAEVKLNYNEIPSVPAEIHVLPSLKVLDLSWNRVEIVPAELSDVPKLKDINLKNNPITDKRLHKLIDQCRSKQVLDYVRQNCPRMGSAPSAKGPSKKGNKKSRQKDQKTTEDEEPQLETTDEVASVNRLIVSRTTDEDQPPNIRVTDAVKSVRGFIVACTIKNVKFDAQSYRKFILMQSKLHDTICDKRNAATIATHDQAKLPPGDLTYTARAPAELKIHPLNRAAVTSGAKLFEHLRAEAEALRREKKRNTFSGVHRYLYLLEGRPVYPCLLDGEQKVVSFPPITNSEDTKISPDTTSILVEVTSAVGQDICKRVLDAVLKETLELGVGGTLEDNVHFSLTVQRVKILDLDGNLKGVYPSKTDLNYEDKGRAVIVIRE